MSPFLRKMPRGGKASKKKSKTSGGGVTETSEHNSSVPHSERLDQSAVALLSASSQLGSTALAEAPRSQQPLLEGEKLLLHVGSVMHSRL